MPRLPALLLAVLALPLSLAPTPSAAHAEDLKVAVRRPIDLVICLDTSGSMQGLIDAARQKLWSIVGDLARLRPEPDLRVALLTYGTPTSGADGDVILRSDLTSDLDRIYEMLFALTTSGGEELVGRVVHTALEQLAWRRTDGLKTLFVAGNESADQDKVQPFVQVMARAKQRGVRVNAIYCGGPDDADAADWRRVAALGDGRFAHIDHNHGTVAVATPFDKELGDLSVRLNSTYVLVGRERLQAEERQKAQDANATSAGAPAAAERAEAKASGLYRLDGDLVRRLAEGRLAFEELAKLPKDELPEELRALDEAGRKAYLEQKAAERTDIEARIQDLSAKRSAYVQKQVQAQGLDDRQALDRVLRDALREQAAAAGFEVEATR